MVDDTLERPGNGRRRGNMACAMKSLRQKDRDRTQFLVAVMQRVCLRNGIGVANEETAVSLCAILNVFLNFLRSQIIMI